MLDLNELDTDDIPGVTREIGNYLAQAAAVCLESHRHEQNIPLIIRGDFSNNYNLVWTPVTTQTLRSWLNRQKVIEEGAAGIAVLLADREIGLEVLLQSWTGTGFDYWLGNNDTLNITTAESKATDELSPLLRDDNLIVRGRMEVSGILNGNDSRVSARMKEKIDQMDRSDYLDLPAYAIVVEFGRPLAEVREKNE